MKRAVALTLIALLVLGTLPFVERAESKQNPDWSGIQKEFKDLFKKKNPLKKRKKGVSAVAKSGDPRGVAVLLKGLKIQEKHVGKMRDEWETQDAEWTEKTVRLESAFEKRRKKEIERAKAKGREPKITIDLNSEEGRWLGAPPKNPGEMTKEKERLQKLYREVLKEEDFSVYILRSIARILNTLDGEEYTKAVKPVAAAALRAPKRYKKMYVRMLGYTKGEPVTKALEKIAQDTNPVVVMIALESLGRQNTERGKQALFGYLDDERWQIRASAIQGLAFYRDAEVIERLMVQAQKEEGAVRRRCFGAMSVIVEEKVKGTIEAWQSWWKSNQDEWKERWAQDPQNGLPIAVDPPVIAVDSEESSGGTSFYGIQTDSKHIIFVVDVSGSMRPNDEAPEDEKPRIDVARGELINALKTLSAVDEDERGAASFNIVLFSTTVETYKEGKMITATKKAKDKAFDWVEEKVVADGMTNIFDALEAAFNIISSSSGKKNLKKGADTIFFMTDGQPNRGKFSDPELIVKEITRMNRERKLTIHTIGVGKGHHVNFLQNLAAANNGKYLAR